MRPMMILAALSLAGCESGPTGKPNPPSGWLMSKPCTIPSMKKDDGDPVARADYEARLRECAADRGDQVRGLQKYARVVSGADK